MADDTVKNVNPPVPSAAVESHPHYVGLRRRRQQRENRGEEHGEGNPPAEGGDRVTISTDTPAENRRKPQADREEPGDEPRPRIDIII